jgi:AraC family transcriptional regulator
MGGLGAGLHPPGRAERRSDELELRVQALVAHGFAELLHRHPEAEDPQAVALRERFAPAFALMDAHFRREPPLAQVAAAVGLSPVHFHRRFRAAFRTTPHEYMLRRRMDLAYQLLSGGTAPIAEVAAACGYEDQFYFSRVFRRRFKASPARFRAARAARR